MLQSLRESLKGPVAKIVVAVAVGAMILFGVESLFVNSVGGVDVASVNGDDISQVELRRAVEQQKNRLRQQFQLEDSSEMLNDDKLRAPALMNLVRQKSLEQAAKRAGMSVSPEVIKADLAKAFVRDGKFDSAFLNNYIAAYGYTPATLAQSEANAYVLRQLFNGVSTTEFLTSAELNAMVAIAAQKRSFNTIFIPRNKVEAGVNLSDEEIAQYYQAHAVDFTEPEMVSLTYVELSAASLASKQDVSDAEVREEYEREIAEFKSATEYRVAHIQLDSAASDNIAEVSKKIASGEDFALLAKTYSTDLGSKESGGDLGVLADGAFPSTFEKAAKALSEGQVSGAVVTDMGTHFIKLTEKKITEAPQFNDRKDALAASLREQKANVEYLDNLKVLEESAFGQANLDAAAAAVGANQLTTELFSRSGGKGLAAEKAVIDAIFADDVYLQGQNSRVLELSGDRAVVARIKDKVPAKLKPLVDVRANIVTQLTNTKVANALQALAADVIVAIEGGKAIDDVAKLSGYELVVHDNVERSAADIDFQVMREVFSMPRPAPGNPSTVTVSGDKGLTVAVLNHVSDGNVDDIPKEQRASIEQQLKNQLASASVEGFEGSIFEEAKYKLK